MLYSYKPNGYSYKKTAALSFAHDINENFKLNDIGSISFSLPKNDDKNKYCQPYSCVRYTDNGELYRILTPAKTIGTATDKHHYQTQHILGILSDNLVFGELVLDNLTTREVIERILSFQRIKLWVLDECDFDYRYSYFWSYENIYKMLMSVPLMFTNDYMWVTNTKTTPFKISLKRIDKNIKPQFYAREGKNLISADNQVNYREVCTVLYLLGMGEGVNQVNVKSINNGLSYITAPQEIIEKYGYIERIFIDESIENPNELLQRGKVVLDGYSKPFYSHSINIADLEKKSNDYLDNPEVGKKIRSPDGDFFIVQTTKHHDKVGSTEIEIGSNPLNVSNRNNLADVITNLAEREDIRAKYSQGNTIMTTASYDNNASPNFPGRVKIEVPTNARQVNYIHMSLDFYRYRSFVQSAAGGGATVTTTKDGGSTTSSEGGRSSTTSNEDGGGSTTSNEGGGQYSSTSTNAQQSQTSDASGQAAVTSGSSSLTTTREAFVTTGGNLYIDTASGRVAGTSEAFNLTGTSSSQPHIHSLTSHTHPVRFSHTHNIAHTHTVNTPSHRHTFTTPQHNHSFSVEAHNHSFTMQAHSHTVNISAHTHTIGNHSHQITLKEHTHALIYGIYEGETASSATIRINGKNAFVITAGTNAIEKDITIHLQGDDGKIRRGAFHIIEVIPNGLTGVHLTVATQFFIQSRGGGDY